MNSYMIFDPAATRAYAGIALRRLVYGPLFWVIYVFLLYPFIRNFLEQDDMNPLGVVVSLLTSFLLIFHYFLRSTLESDKLPPFDTKNLAEELSFKLIHFIHKNTPTIESIFKGILKSSRARFIMKEMGLTKKEVWTVMKNVQEEISVSDWMQEATLLQQELREDKIHGSILFFLCLTHIEPLKNLLNTRNLSLSDVKKILRWEVLHSQARRQEHVFHPHALIRTFGSLGRSWSMGYTHELDALTEDMSAHIRWTGKHLVVLHREEIAKMFHILSRKEQKNIIVIGQAGTGKRTLVQNFAFTLREAERKQGRTYTRVLLFKPEILLAGTENPEAFLLQALAQAQKAGRFILIIHNLGMFMEESNAKLRGLLLQFLQLSNISLIGLADAQQYHTLIKKESAFDGLFEKVFLTEASEEDTMGVLMDQYFRLEKKGVHITYKALKSIIELTQRYIGAVALPGKATAIMEDAILTAKAQKKNMVTESIIREAISHKAHMNVQEVTGEEKDILIGLEETMKKRIIGQDHSIHLIVNALKRSRLDLGSRSRPQGTFLFLGPTGVGKTETAKVLADEYFGSVDNIIRLDMNEYSHPNSVYEIIGSPDSGKAHEEGFLTQKVQDHPASLILLDEIEKAHKTILNVFLQILDEGHLIDGRGIKTDFRSTIIIATSNAGALLIRDHFKHGLTDANTRTDFKQELVEAILKEGLFSPEFLNRFDEVVLYTPLTNEQTVQLAILMLDAFIKEFEEKKGIGITMEKDVVTALAEKGYSTEFGAREMRRVITDIFQTYIANELLKNNVQRGETIAIKKEYLDL